VCLPEYKQSISVYSIGSKDTTVASLASNSAINLMVGESLDHQHRLRRFCLAHLLSSHKESHMNSLLFLLYEDSMAERATILSVLRSQNSYLYRKVISGQVPIEVYGIGRQTRTFTHSRDAATTHFLCTENKNAIKAYPYFDIRDYRPLTGLSLAARIRNCSLLHQN
jgi:hypothetical protein